MEFDLGPLSWVQGEIDQALSRGLAALSLYRAPPHDASALKHARTHVHQAAGAIQMVGLDAVVAFTDEIERQLAGLDDLGSPGEGRAACDAVDRACRKLQIFLAEIVNGTPPAPLKLFPEYEAMQRVRGLRVVAPTDLFYPDLSPRAPVSDDVPPPASKLHSHLVKQRRTYQRGLLDWLRGEEAGVAAMREAVGAIEHATTSPPLRAFWWTTGAVFDAVLHHGLDPGFGVKQLAARIDLQVRRVVEGSGKVADRLRREVLYYVAISAPVVPSVQAVQRGFRLAELIPSAEVMNADLVRLQPLLREAREHLSGAKEAWLKFTSGRAENLPKLKQTLAAVHRIAAEIGNGALMKLTASLVERLEKFPTGNVPEPLAMEYATGMLLAENAFENDAGINAEFPKQVEVMLERLDAAQAARPMVGQTAAPLLDEMSRRAQERLLLAQVGREIQANLRHMEQVLDAFFRDNSKRAELVSLAKDSQQIRGALQMLDLHDADRLLGLCQAQIQTYADPDAAVSNDDLELLAESLSGLGFYIEAVEQQRPDRDRLIAPLLARRLGEVQGVVEPAPVESAEAAVAELRNALPRLVEEVHRAPADAVAHEALKTKLAELRNDAELIGDPDLVAQAASALNELASGGAAALAAAVTAMADTAAPAPEISAETQRLLATDATSLDAELVEIYLAEADEVLDSIRDHLALLAGNHGDREALRTIRRGFHTLKGSGRMVGLMDLGEIAYDVEKIHNRLLEEERPVTRAVQRMIEVAERDFRLWVDALSRTGKVVADPADLHAAIRAVEFELPGGRESVLTRIAPAPAVPQSDAIAAAPEVVSAEELPVTEANAPTPALELEPMPSDEVVPALDKLAGRAIATDALAPEDVPPLDLAELGSVGTDGITAPIVDFDDQDAGAAIDFVPVAEPTSSLEITDFDSIEPPPTAIDTERLEAERLEAERLEAERLEAERLEAERQEAERQEAERQEAERQEAERQEAERQEAERQEAERQEAERQEAERQEAERQEAERREAERCEAERREAERLEAERLEAERLEAERLEAERLEAERLEAERLEAERLEAERLEAERLEAERLEAERLEAERLEAERLEAERLEAERLEAERLEAERLEAEQHAAVASATLGDLVAPVSPEPDEVTVGGVTLSAVLLGILLDEADQHLATLAHGLAVLQFDPQQQPSQEMVRASHTLCGIHRTSGFPLVAALARTLELCLIDLQFHEPPLPPSVQPVLARAVMVLDALVARIRSRVAFDADDEAEVADVVREVESLRKIPSDRAVDAESRAADLAERDERASSSEHGPADAAVVPNEPSVADAAARDSQAASAAADFTLLPETAVLEAQLDANAALPSPVTEPPWPASPRDALEGVADDVDAQVLPIFLEEATELFPRAGETLRAWRRDPEIAQHAAELRRTLHTLKGSARMAGAMRLGQLTHEMEARLLAGDGVAAGTPALFDALEADLDNVSFVLDALRDGRVNVELPATAAVVALPPLGAAHALAPASWVAAGAVPVDEQEAVPERDMESAVAEAAAPEPDVAQRALLRVRADVIDRLVNEAGEVSIARARVEGELRSLKANLLELTNSVIRLRKEVRELEIQGESQIQSRMSQVGDAAEGFDPLEFDRFTRFQELTRSLAEGINDVSTVQQSLLRNLDDADAALVAQSRLSRDLQQQLFAIRTVPFGSLSDRLYRILRQLAKELDKRANLEIRGGQVELDRAVLEKLVGPLEHLLRNALDHGIEPREKRLAAGKSETGEIALTVRQVGNEIAIEIADDGGGLNLDEIRAKAIAQQRIAADAELTTGQLVEYIFHAGFSTASQVTQVSGRGIGMDVVRSEIAALGGRIEVSTRTGQGTTFLIYLPLTLAVAQAVLVRAGGRIWALPAPMVEQVQQLKPDELLARYVAGQVDWQGRSYPFHYLPRLLGDTQHRPEASRHNAVLLLRSGPSIAAVHVDEMVGNQEVVVKNIGPQLARVSGIAGATVLGNGEIVLIINPVQLAQRVGIAAIEAGADERLVPGITHVVPSEARAPLIMVVDDSLTVRKITSRLLAREGFKVMLAKDGVDALEVLAGEIPDVMLLDIEMPRMDGFELTRNLKADPRLAHIPIIMITSRTAEKHRERARTLGVDLYLGKPYQEDELLGHLREMLALAT
ncbi:MAG: Hpt domain-containing protein [Betaproteobacteria bacterium]|nr:Hpt domain-containing protein [Betaproteobacteria bacterium]